MSARWELLYTTDYHHFSTQYVPEEAVEATTPEEVCKEFHCISAKLLEEKEPEEYDESMDGDFDSAMTSIGWGTDEDYNHYDYT